MVPRPAYTRERRIHCYAEGVRISPFATAALVLVTACSLNGCHHTAPDQHTAQLEHAQQVEVARQDLSTIPPPSKSLYMNVGNLESWENPSLTVQENMITLHVLMPDANPSDLGKGTMLRPVAARMQVLNIDPNNLAEALNAIPKDAWPYGRVVAIEEARNAPRSVQVQLRRNIEAALDTLNNIGVVAFEWNNGRPVGNR